MIISLIGALKVAVWCMQALYTTILPSSAVAASALLVAVVMLEDSTNARREAKRWFDMATPALYVVLAFAVFGILVELVAKQGSFACTPPSHQ